MKWPTRAFIAVTALLYACDRKIELLGEHLYFQDEDCLIMGRAERPIKWGPPDTIFKLHLLCRHGSTGDYGSDVFFETGSANLVRILSDSPKTVRLEYCPLFDTVVPTAIASKFAEIQAQYPEEMHLNLSTAEKDAICEEAFGLSWREPFEARNSES